MKMLAVSEDHAAGSIQARPSVVRKVLLLCGVLTSLLYVLVTVLVARQWQGYSPMTQGISELFAIDAPTRPLMVPLLTVYSLLMYAFGIGVWQSAGDKHTLRLTGALLVGKEILGFVATVITPMHLRGTEGTLTDILHLVFTMLGVLCMLFAMVFARNAFGKGFRIYSIVTILIFFVNGALAFGQVPRLTAEMSTPWMGITERINIYVYILWVVVLAIGLLRARSGNLKAENR